MSESQTVWMILSRRALRSERTESFEISEILPEVEKSLGVDEGTAQRFVAGLLTELERMPAGKQYFRREGNAVVPLPELSAIPRDPESEFAAYPYEL